MDDTERCETCEMSGWEHTTDELLIPVWENPDDYNRGEGPDYLGCTNCHTMRPVDTGTERIEDTEIVPREELEQTGNIEGVPVYACPRCDYQRITEDCDCPDCGWAGMCQEDWS